MPAPLTAVKHGVSKVMRLDLKPYPGIAAGAVEALGVEIERSSPSNLSVRYALAGDIGQIVVPGWVARSRADELWRTTCFELFIRKPAGEGYFEFNLSPSGQWAVYRFDAYRSGMADQDGVEIRNLERLVDDRSLVLSVILDLDRLGLGDGAFRLGLSAVVEERSGEKSYWALAHPSDKPDFHHPDSFVLELP